jgi:class 3 adenylate cyclase
LFASEVISPTEQVTVGSQVVLFTDLRGSTSLYHDLGDAPAYALVRNHFSVLVDAIRAHHGTVVKTIGDAVMAAFSRVEEALAAVRQMHQKLPAANPGLAVPLALKSSLHAGPCLAVNANDKLDYFGTTINLAARMVECCQGGDLTVSDEIFHRPEMSRFLEAMPGQPEPSEVRFRGFDVPHRVWRITMV